MGGKTGDIDGGKDILVVGLVLKQLYYGKLGKSCYYNKILIKN